MSFLPETIERDPPELRPQAVNLPEFKFTSASDLTAQPTPTDWLLENFVEKGSLNLLFGEPGACKTLFALEWAFCMAAGLSWNDCRTKQTDVVIIVGEGYRGTGRRFKALEAKYGIKAPARLFISQRPAQLSDEVNTQWVAKSIEALCPNVGLVIIDTLHRNMTGDENSSQDIGQFINNIDTFIRPLGAAVLVVHHSGHGVKDRSRGSSSIRAAMDGEFSCVKSNDLITLSCCKAKDFEAVAPLQFSIKKTALDGWLDSDGEQINSVYLEYEGTGSTDGSKNKSRPRLSGRNDAILTALGRAIDRYGIEPSTDITDRFGGFGMTEGRKVVHLDDWRKEAYPVIDVEPSDRDREADRKRTAFNRAKETLRKNHIQTMNDYWWKILD